jgi:uncharacterized protein
MFGFGLTKLLFTVLVVAAVWYGFKAFTGRGSRSGGGAVDDEQNPRIDAEDMTACPVCGHYVAGDKATSCGRGDCPYPKK